MTVVEQQRALVQVTLGVYTFEPRRAGLRPPHRRGPPAAAHRYRVRVGYQEVHRRVLDIRKAEPQLGRYPRAQLRRPVDVRIVRVQPEEVAVVPVAEHVRVELPLPQKAAEILHFLDVRAAVQRFDLRKLDQVCGPEVGLAVGSVPAAILFVRGEGPVVPPEVPLEGEMDLVQIVPARGGLGEFRYHRKRRGENRQQHSDDGDNDKQFQQREAPPGRSAPRRPARRAATAVAPIAISLAGLLHGRPTAWAPGGQVSLRGPFIIIYNPLPADKDGQTKAPPALASAGRKSLLSVNPDRSPPASSAAVPAEPADSRPERQHRHRLGNDGGLRYFFSFVILAASEFPNSIVGWLNFTSL